MINFRISGTLSLFLLGLSVAALCAVPASAAQITKGIVTEGYCAVVGMTAEQSQLTALQRARAAAIEQVAGIAVSSSTLVTDFTLTADFIKTYTKGFIVAEKVEWLPLGQYQKDPSMAPIPEYRVKIVADVSVPEAKGSTLVLQARSDKSVYRSGETAYLEMRTARQAKVAIFNIMANDRVVMLLPNEHEGAGTSSGRDPFIFPGAASAVELVMQNLPGHTRDAEAFLVVAIDAADPHDFSHYFPRGKEMSFAEFFRRYAEIADHAEDSIVTYQVVER